MKSPALFALFLRALVPCCCVSLSFAQTWCPTADFSAERGNPNGVWSYGWSPADLSLFHPYAASTQVPDVPLWGCRHARGDEPTVWINSTGSTLHGIVEGQLSLQPGSRGEASVLRWTAPKDLSRGFLMVHAVFSRGDSGVARLAVRVNGSTHWTANDSGIADVVVPSAGVRTVEFAAYGVTAGGDTGLNAWITLSPPGPADFNVDGAVNRADIDAFLSDWAEGRSAADMNGDGGMDLLDVQEFLDLWKDGCRTSPPLEQERPQRLGMR